MTDTEKKSVSPHRRTIGIVIATDIEAQPFIAALHLSPVGRMPCLLYGRDGLILAVSGVGKTNSAVATTYLCSAFHPALILNLGAAGSTGLRCRLGDIFQVSAVCEPDRPHYPSGRPSLHRPRTLPGFDEATLATHDRPIIDKEDREKASLHAEMVDMEGAAVVQAARRFSIPCLLFKFVSDTPGQSDTAAAIEYMREHSRVFCRFIMERVIPLVEALKPFVK